MKDRTILAASLLFLLSGASLAAQAGKKPDPAELMQAVNANDAAKVRDLLQKGADANALDGYTSYSNDGSVLMFAALQANLEIVRLLLDNGANADYAEASGLTALSYAILNPAGYETARLLVERGAKVNVSIVDAERKKVSALKKAALDGRLDIVDLLAPRAGADGKKQLDEAFAQLGEQAKVDAVEALLARGYSPEWDMESADCLVRAARAGRLDVVIAILKLGVPVDAPDAQAITPLAIAADQGKKEVLRYLLKMGAQPNAKDAQGRTALSRAKDGHRDEIAMLLLSAGARGDLIDAVRIGDLPAVKKLVNRESANSREKMDPPSFSYVEDVDSSGKQVKSEFVFGNSPLILAIQGGRLDIAKLLVENGAIVDDRCYFPGRYGDTYSRDAMEVAVDLGKADIVNFLISKGGRVSDELLLTACSHGYLDVVKLLAEKGANVNVTMAGYPWEEFEGESYSWYGDPISAAIESGEPGLVDYLRKKGAKLSVYDLVAAVRKSDTALVRECLAAGLRADANCLVWACMRNDMDIATAILKKGLDVNQLSASGWTPLTMAAREGNFTLVKLLIEEGADASLTNRQGESALDLTEGKSENGLWEIANFLRQTGPGPGAYRERGAMSAAVLKQDLAALKRLFESNADPKALFLPPEGSALARYPPSLIDVACVLENKGMIQLFLSRGLNLDDVGKGLSYLAADGRLDLADLLLSSKGAKEETLKRRLGEMLSIAAKTGNAQLASFALAKGADPNSDLWGNPLLYAAQQDSLAVAAVLLDHGASADAAAKYSGMPNLRFLDWLINNGQGEMAKLFLAHGMKGAALSGWSMNAAVSLVRSGDIQLALALVKNGADPNQAEKGGDAVLHIAAERGELELVKALAEKGAYIGASDARGETALMRAAALPGRQAVIAYLLRQKTMAGVPNFSLFTPIDAIFAYGAWNDEIIALLSDSYAAVHATDSLADARQRLSLALMKRDFAQAASLIERWDNLPKRAGFHDRSLLMGCAARGDLEAMKILLDSGADPLMEDRDGVSALDLAARSGKPEAVNILLPLLPKSPDPRERALRQAAFSGQTELLVSFMKEGVNPDATVGEQASALFLAASEGRKAAVDILVSAKASIDRKCLAAKPGAQNAKLTPAETAAAKGRWEVAEALAARGAKIDWIYAFNATPAENRLGFVKFFLAHSSPEERKKPGSDILYTSAMLGDSETVKLLALAGVTANGALEQMLLSSGASHRQDAIITLAEKGPLSAFEDSGGRALVIACENGYLGLVKALLAKGADANFRDKPTFWNEEGPSLLRIAAYSGYPAIMELLVAKGAKDRLNPPELVFLKEIEK